MARHNREGSGEDQRGFDHTVNYQPDWLKLVKVTRALETGRQSTKTLVRNPHDHREAEPGDRVRTRITSPAQGVDFEVSVHDPRSRVVRFRVACVVRGENGAEEEVEYTVEGALPPPTRR